MTSSPITSWKIGGETVETVEDFIFLDSKSLQMVTAATKFKDSCFLTCIQTSQEVGKLVCYSHLFQNFPVYYDLHSQRLCIVNKTEIDIFLELSCLFDDPADVGNLISGKRFVNANMFTF